MSVKTDDIAHDLQNGIDLVMDDLKKIRDKVPCSCGQEVSGDISVETALEIEQVARWIHSESDEPISEIEDLLLKMSTKDFYDEYEVVLETLKEREN